MPFGEIPIELARESKSGALSDCSSDHCSVSDALSPDLLKSFACTFNIASNRIVNHKRWCRYHWADQISLLCKILYSHCYDFCISVDRSRIAFEMCPKSENMHIHCVLNVMYLDDVNDLVSTINDKYSPKDYITFLAEEVYDTAGWLRYMRKNSSGVNIH